MIEDSRKCKKTLNESYRKFLELPENIQNVLFSLLAKETEFRYFFDFFHDFNKEKELECLDKEKLVQKVHEIFSDSAHKDFLSYLEYYIQNYPQALAYCIMKKVHGIQGGFQRWVLKKMEGITQMHEFMVYGYKDTEKLEKISKQYLKNYFGFDEFKTDIQKDGVVTSLNGKNLILGLPTGGGKSLTFQLPALIQAEKLGKLTVVITPLRSLMKDQVDNLVSIGVYNVAFRNSDLNPLEREELEYKIAFGDIGLLYITPETLRSQRFFNLLKRRQIDRFVIDEAHCLIDRGIEFRPDYFFIGDFVKKLEKANGEDINISCFSATTKKDVLDGIQDEFQQKIGKQFEVFTSTTKRENLNYYVEPVCEEEKSIKLLEFLKSYDLEQNPTIIFVRKTKPKEQEGNDEDLSYAENLAGFLNQNGISAQAFHGKMKDIQKTKIQNDFIDGRLNLIVATKAFGMGIDKKNIRYIIHYNIPSSLEEYLQETGRAGRDGKQSNCQTYFTENDMNELYDWEKSSRISKNMLNRVYRYIKKGFNNKKYLSVSKLSSEMKIPAEKLKKIIMVLERFGYIKRDFDKTQVFVNKSEVNDFNKGSRQIEKSGMARTDKEVADHMFRLIFNYQSFSLEDVAVEFNRTVAQVSEILNKLKMEGIVGQREGQNEGDVVIMLYKDVYGYNSRQLLGKYRNLIDDLISFFSSREKFTRDELIKSILRIRKPAENKFLNNMLDYLVYNKFIKSSYNYFYVSEDIGKLREDLEDKINWSQTLMDFFKKDEKKDFEAKRIKFSYESFNNFLYKEDEEQLDISSIKKYLLFMHNLCVIDVKYGLLVFRKRYTIDRVSDKDEFEDRDFEKFHEMETKKFKLDAFKSYFNLFMEGEDNESFVRDYFSLNSDELVQKYNLGQENS